MFFLTLPTAVNVGDTVECKINGRPKRVTYRDAGTLVIQPDGDVRDILDVCHDGDGELRTFVCGDSHK